MQPEDNNEIPGSTSPHSDNEEVDNESEVEYPLIDLKTGLSSDISEKRQKDIEKFTTRGRRGSNFKKTEFSREVLGHNKMFQFQMSKAVNYFFSEFDYLREKIKRAQQQTVKQLQDIHCEKRRQIRESYLYHNEELRYDIRRKKEEEKFLAEQAELEERMRRRENSIARISQERKMLIKETNMKEKGILKRKEKDRVAKVNQIQIEQPTNQISQSRSHSFLHAGAIEVMKDFNNPRTVKRSMEMVKSQDQLTPILPPVDKDATQEAPIDIPITEVDHRDSLKLNQIPCEEELIGKEYREPIMKRKTAKNAMKAIRQEKQKQLKEILNLPYNIYRRNSKGKLQKVEYPMPKREFKEPSNKDKYKMRKALGEEKEKYQNYISDLVKTTESIIEEDINISSQLNETKLKIVKETVAEPQRRIGSTDWINAYIHSNIPEDIDPSSTEAIIYCRYIRLPLRKYRHLPDYQLYHTPP